MREIKFKAWDKEKKVWIDKFYVADEGYAMGVMGNYFPEEIEPLENIILCQYTDLKDKNGKEIYEGDIVQDHGFGSGLPVNQRNNIGRVYQGNGGTWLWTRPNNEIDQIGGGETLLSVIQFDEAEVIGNIYENPELLK